MERILIGFVLGAVIGSFIDCMANRSVTKQSFWGRSACDHCKTVLAWYQLIPILSYLWLKGRCKRCHKSISLESTLVEIATGLITATILYLIIPANFLLLPWPTQLSDILDISFKLFAVYVFLIVFITDLKTGLIPDRITYPAIITSSIMLIVFASIKIGLLYWGLKASPLGQYLLPPASDYFYRHALYIVEPVGFSFLAALAVGLFFLTLIVVTSGRGMGGGDMKLGIFIGLALGAPQALTVIMLAFLLGSVFGILLILFRLKKFGQTIPFGPFLSLASIISLFWGEQLLNWYWSLKIL